jgi:hypothetical protein
MSVYGRLNFTQGSANFNGADQLTQNTLNFISNTSINLNQWQIDELANNTVGGYYQNPHSNTLTNLVIVLNNFITTCNTSQTTFTYANTAPNVLIATASSTLTSISNFLTHTNNIAGVTNSSNTALYPDLNSALAVGRQMLNITNKTDSVQNNTPIIGNFTSLYVVSNINSGNNTIYGDYNKLLNTITVVGGNNVSNITDSQMNVFISDISSTQSIMDTQRNGDITFYTNSLGVLKDYQTLLQFTNLGATQNSLIQVIGTSKLHSKLGY